ncbi:DoxX-like family protein [Cardiobacteriaceae bacterium TAE3-ERU3]|nr:DoxX-like family protein [Cardiobacteriaceae bacterium TAE3-ERU3]
MKLLNISIAVMWLYSGLQPLLTATAASLQLLATVGISEAWRLPLLVTASAIDCIFALWTLLKPSRLMWYAQAGTVIAYTAIITLFLPQAWLDPLGAAIKNLPLIALMLYLANHSEEQS